MVNNYPRTYRVHTPQSVCNTGGATAMLMCLHGWQQDAAWACDAMCAPYAQSRGIVAVCPQGTPDTTAFFTHGRVEFGWNTEPGTGWSAVDDVAFLRRLIGHVNGHVRIPQNLTYTIGFSLGGGMAYRLMCNSSDLISGFGVVAQPGPYGRCSGFRSFCMGC